MMQPATAAVIAATRTAAAETSFINFICGCLCSDIRSMIFSIAVLKSSATHTKPTANTNTNASEVVTLIQILRAITAIVAIKCRIIL